MTTLKNTLVGRTAYAAIPDGMGGLLKEQQVEIVAAYLVGGEVHTSCLVLSGEKKGKVVPQPATWLTRIDTNPPTVPE
jgi:hypothetical protein